MGIAKQEDSGPGVGASAFNILEIKGIRRAGTSRSGLQEASQPLLRIDEKKQLYTGVAITTLSPGRVSALMTAGSAGTTPVV